MKAEWTNRDWKWLIGLLIGIISILIIIIIGIIAVRLSDNIEIVNVISIGAGLVSMVLGIVAIIYAFIQSRESGEQNRQLNVNLNKIDNRIYTLDEIIKDMKIVKNKIEQFKISSEDNFNNLAYLITNTINSAKYEELGNDNELKRDIDIIYEELYNVLDELTPREEKVLRLRFGLDNGRTRTLEEVGKEFNLAKSTIREIETKALNKLGAIFLNQKLSEIRNKLNSN